MKRELQVASLSVGETSKSRVDIPSIPEKNPSVALRGEITVADIGSSDKVPIWPCRCLELGGWWISRVLRASVGTDRPGDLCAGTWGSNDDGLQGGCDSEKA